MKKSIIVAILFALAAVPAFADDSGATTGTQQGTTTTQQGQTQQGTTQQGTTQQGTTTTTPQGSSGTAE